MSRMRTVFALTLMAVIAVALAAQAQEGGKRQGRPGAGRGQGGGFAAGMLLRNEKVQAELKLTDEQKEKLRGIGRDASREEAEKKLAEILNADQVKRLKEIRLQVGGAMMLVEPAVAKELGLSEEQVAKIREVQRASRESMRDVPQEERRAKMQEVQKETMAKTLEVLTPEQRAKLEKMKGAKVEIDLFRGARGGRRPAAAK